MKRWLLAAAAWCAVALPAAEAARATLLAARPGARPLTLQAVSSAEYWTISVLDGGAESQRIEVQSDLPETLPRLADVDGDGAPDLWVPVIGGNANTAWDVWLMQPRQARFRRGGEVSGLAFSRDAAGRLVTLGRNGCCSVDYTFLDVTAEGALREAFSIERRLDERGGESCEARAIAIDPPAAVVTATCRLAPGRMPGRLLRVP
jgi:hypothetical protein